MQPTLVSLSGKHQKGSPRVRQLKERTTNAFWLVILPSLNILLHFNYWEWLSEPCLEPCKSSWQRLEFGDPHL